MEAALTPGQQVRFTAALGLVKKDTPAGKFEAQIVEIGDLGEYIGPHPTIDGWSLIAVGEQFICPCHSSQFEAV